MQDFNFGCIKEDYCSYDNSILQVCDYYLDIILYLHDLEKCDFNLFFGYFCGNDKQCPDSLNMNEMIKVYGGRQRRIHNSEMKDTSLGRFTSALNKIQNPSFKFKNEDEGVLCMC